MKKLIINTVQAPHTEMIGKPKSLQSACEPLKMSGLLHGNTIADMPTNNGAPSAVRFANVKAVAKLALYALNAAPARDNTVMIPTAARGVWVRGFTRPTQLGSRRSNAYTNAPR